MAETWTMIHRDENDNVTDEFKPLNCSFTKRYQDCGDIAYDLPLSYPRMRWSIVGPKRTSFELWNDAYPDRPIISGIHSYINTKRGSELLHIQGKTWLWYFQNRHYPFNPQSPNAFLAGSAANDQGLAYQEFGDPTDILQDIWTEIKTRPNGNKWGITIQGIPTGISTGYRVELGDTKSLFDMFQDLSQVEPGFIFYDNVAREVVIVSPHLYNDNALDGPATNIYSFDRNTPPVKWTDIEFENNGPIGTHILGLGSGTSSRIGRAYGYGQSEEIFGRWDMTVDFSETMSTNKLVAQTQRAFSKGLYPQRNVPLTVRPEDIPGFWVLFEPGWSVWIHEDFESNKAEGAYEIMEMAAHLTNEGDSLVDLTVNELNPLGRPGSVEG